MKYVSLFFLIIAIISFVVSILLKIRLKYINKKLEKIRKYREHLDSTQ